MSSIQKLKFRTFSSKQKQGFIIYTIGPELPLMMLEDMLFQLFKPLFPNILCPEIYFFSSTDEILKMEDLYNIQDFVYVHFLERIQRYKRQSIISQKFQLGSLQKLSTGIGIQGTTLYIFSQKQYMMYGKDIFLKNTIQSIKNLEIKHNRKQSIYNQYFKQLQVLKDNIQMISLKDQLKDKVEHYNSKVQNLEVVYSRYMKAKSTLLHVLQKSGINIKRIQDLS